MNIILSLLSLVESPCSKTSEYDFVICVSLFPLMLQKHVISLSLPVFFGHHYGVEDYRSGQLIATVCSLSNSESLKDTRVDSCGFHFASS